jgi:hypothetical protein
MVEKAAAVVETGRIHDQQTGASEQKNSKRQQAIKALEHWGCALENRGFVENGGHVEIIGQAGAAKMPGVADEQVAPRI